MAGDDRADAVLVRRLDAHLDAGVEGDAGRIEIDVVAAMLRVGADQLGLAVKLAQRDAERAEEAKGVGPERRAAGGRCAQAREPEAVAQRAQQQGFGDERAPSGGERRQSGVHAEVIEALLERRGVQHPGADIRGDRLPDPRREQHEGRGDLPKVVHHRVGRFDEVDLHPAQQRFAERVDLLHDPGQRQHRHVLVVRPLRLEREVGGAVAQQARGRQHGELRVRRGAGGRAQDRDRVALRGIDETVVQPGLARGARASAPRQLVRATAAADRRIFAVRAGPNR